MKSFVENASVFSHSWKEMLARSERFLRHMESGDVHVTPINGYRVLNMMVKRNRKVRCASPDERAR
jgi:hypothetical protein